MSIGTRLENLACVGKEASCERREIEMRRFEELDLQLRDDCMAAARRLPINNLYVAAPFKCMEAGSSGFVLRPSAWGGPPGILASCPREL